MASLFSPCAVSFTMCCVCVYVCVCVCVCLVAWISACLPACLSISVCLFGCVFDCGPPRPAGEPLPSSCEPSRAGVLEVQAKAHLDSRCPDVPCKRQR